MWIQAPRVLVALAAIEWLVWYSCLVVKVPPEIAVQLLPPPPAPPPNPLGLTIGAAPGISMIACRLAGAPKRSYSVKPSLSPARFFVLTRLTP